MPTADTELSLSRLQMLPVIQYASIHTAADPLASGCIYAHQPSAMLIPEPSP